MEKSLSSRNKSFSILRSTKSFGDVQVASQHAWGTETYPTHADAYTVEKEVGKGAMGTVYKAHCKTLDQTVAIKTVEFDKLTCDLDVIIRETQIMHDQRHYNVLPLYCSFVKGHALWLVMPFVSGGSLGNVLQASFAEGFDEVSVATIGRDLLCALQYMHAAGRIHRDIKAANVLLDLDGHIMLGDFGVTATLERAEKSSHFANDSSASSSSWEHGKYLARNTFCGTPCFMAPEVMEQTQGYDTSADIWSFGILMFELACGKAPYANMSLTKVILTTLHEEAPTLEGLKGRKFPEDMVDLIAQCLNKEPSDRPSAGTLLRHRFFRRAQDSQWLVKNILSKAQAMSDRPLFERLKSMRLASLKAIKHGDAGKLHAVAGKASSVYATATLSGDVANALALLKRLTKPSSRKAQRGLLIPPDELAECEGIAFCALRRAGVGVSYGRGNGFVVAKKRPQKPENPNEGSRRGRRHHISKVQEASAEQRVAWTAPSYFNVVVGGGTSGIEWKRDDVEAIFILPTLASVEAFKAYDADLDRIADPDDQIFAYGVDNKDAFEAPLAGCKVHCNREVNARIFGHTVGPVQLLGGDVKPPHEFDALYKLLTALASETEDHSASMLGHIDDSGSTLIYRMPHWLYD